MKSTFEALKQLLTFVLTNIFMITALTFWFTFLIFVFCVLLVFSPIVYIISLGAHDATD